MKPKNPVQGEGNYEAAERFDEEQRAFVQSGKVGENAGKAAPKSRREEKDLEQAEAAGRARSRGDDKPAAKPGTTPRRK